MSVLIGVRNGIVVKVDSTYAVSPVLISGVGNAKCSWHLLSDRIDFEW